MATMEIQKAVPDSCWADNPHVLRIARQVHAMIASLPDLTDKDVKMEIRKREGYVQMLVVCTFRISNREKGD